MKKVCILFLTLTLFFLSNPSYSFHQSSSIKLKNSLSNYIKSNNPDGNDPNGNDTKSNNSVNNPLEDSIATEKDRMEIDYPKVLEELGYYKKDSSSEDLNLRNSIIRFQSDHNLKADGVWGENSILNLGKRIETGDFKYKDNVLKPPSSGKWIVINKTKRILTLYEGKNVLKKYPVAVGKPISLTPNGKFIIVNKLINPTWLGGGYAEPVKGGDKNNPLGERWIGISYKGGGRIGTHGNASPYSIGLSVSHGCIRMINSDVKEYFEIVTLNTAVWIGTEDILKEWGITQEEYFKK